MALAALGYPLDDPRGRRNPWPVRGSVATSLRRRRFAPDRNPNLVGLAIRDEAAGVVRLEGTRPQQVEQGSGAVVSVELDQASRVELLALVKGASLHRLRVA